MQIMLRLLASVALPCASLMAQYSVTNGLTTLNLVDTPGVGIQMASSANGTNTPFTFRTGAAAGGALDIWKIELYDTVSKQKLEVCPSNSTWTGYAIPASASVFLYLWAGVHHPLQAGNETFDVTAVFTVQPGDKVAEMTIVVDGSTNLPTYSVFSVDYPRFEVQQRSQDAMLSMPVVGGWLVPNPSTNPDFAAATQPSLVDIAATHPGALSMQWFSYYSIGAAPAGSLFFGTRDPDGHLKQLIVRPAPQANPGVSVAHRKVLAGSTTVKSFVSKYPYVVGIVGDDWYDCAKFYRSWALGQSFVPPPMNVNPNFSTIIRDASVFATYSVPVCPLNENLFEHSKYTYWRQDLQEQITYFGAGDIPSFNYNWDESAFDSVWGRWLPVRPEFATAAANTAAGNHPFAPYFLCNLYSDQDQFYWMVQPAAVQMLDGSILGNHNSVPDRHGSCTAIPVPVVDQFVVELCPYPPNQKEYAKYYAALLAYNHGIKGMYLDTFSWARAVECYDASHGHPLGGGSWHTQAKRALVKDLRTTQRDTTPQFYTYSESQNEMYLDCFELVFEHVTGDLKLALPSIIRAPIFETVYHEFQLTSNVLGIHLPPNSPLNNATTHFIGRHFYAARLYFGGTPFAGAQLDQQTLQTSLGVPSYAAFMTAAKNAISVLKLPHVRAMTTFGERVRDPITTSPVTTVTLGNLRPNGGAQPLVFASAWARKDLAHAGVFLQNWTQSGDSLGTGIAGGTQTIQITANTVDLGLTPNQQYTMFEQDPTASTPIVLGSYVPGTTVTFTTTVPALSAKFIYFQ